MASDKLYKLAFEFKKLKLWKVLNETQIFGVKTDSGEILYCVILGELGEHFALLVYPGVEGLDSYRKLFESDELTDSLAENFFVVYSQCCLQCSFENKDMLSDGELEEVRDYAKRNDFILRGKNAFPKFTKNIPWHVPALLSDEDEKILEQALNATFEIAEKYPKKLPKGIEFSEGDPYDRKIPLLEFKRKNFSWSMTDLPESVPEKFPAPKISKSLAKNLKAAKKTNEVLCEVLITPVTCSDNEDENILHLRTILIVIDGRNGKILNPPPDTKDYGEESARVLVENFANILLDKSLNKVPKRIFVRNERTFSLLKDFCEQGDIKLVFEEDLPAIDDFEENILQAFDYEGDDVDEKISLEMQKEMISLLIDKLSELPERELKKMPQDMRILVEDMLEEGILPPNLEKKLKKIF